MAYTEQQIFTEPNGDAFGFAYGISLSSDGNKALITSAYYDATNTDNGGGYIHTRSGTTWSLAQTISVPSLPTNSHLGSGGAISANGLYVAMLSTGIPHKGYVFAWDGANWGLQATLAASNGTDLGSDSSYNTEVSLDSTGALLVISNPTVNTNTGQATVFSRSGTTWNEQQILTPGISGEQFGTSVTISGDGSTIAVGAKLAATGGAVYVFTLVGETWTAQPVLVEPDDPIAWWAFGSSVALSYAGDFLAVGAPGADGTLGAYYIFHWSGTAWVQQTKVTPVNRTDTGTVGVSIGIDAIGGTVVAGYVDDVNAINYISIISRSESTWTEVQQITPSDSPGDIWFGTSVAISADASTILSAGVRNFSDNRAYVLALSTESTVTGNIQFDDLICSAQILVPSIIQADIILDTVTVSGVLSTSFLLSADIFLAPIQITAGIVVPSTIQANIVLDPAFSSASLYSGGNTITGDVTFDDLTCVAVLQVVDPRYIIGGIMLDNLIAQGVLAVGNALSADILLDSITFSGALVRPNTVQANIQLDSITVSGVLAQVNTLQANIQLDSLIIKGILAYPNTIQANIQLDSIIVSGVFVQPNTLQANIQLDSLIVSGVLAYPNTIQANIQLDSITGSGILVQPNILQANIQLDPFTITMRATDRTFSFHPDHDSFTEYLNFNFNSFARIGGTYFAANDRGLYILGGNTDSGDSIPAHVLTGLLDFGGTTMTRVPRAYFDLTSDADIRVTVYTSFDGKRRAEPFVLSIPASQLTRSACVPLARGLASRMWQYRVENTSGGNFSFNRFSPNPIPLSRSI